MSNTKVGYFVGSLATALINRKLALALIATCGSAQASTDLGKKACAQEARRLCPAEMRTFSRRKVEACMIFKIDQTSAICRAAMLRIKSEREATKFK